MKRNYQEDYTAELVFEMKDGTINYAFGTPIREEIGFLSDICLLWSAQEFQRLPLQQRATLPFAFYLPHSDLSFKREDGFISIFRNNNLLFMLNRNEIKRIMSGINDCLVDFREQT